MISTQTEMIHFIHFQTFLKIPQISLKGAALLLRIRMLVGKTSWILQNRGLCLGCARRAGGSLFKKYEFSAGRRAAQ